MLEKIKSELIEKLIEEIKNKDKYKTLLKDLILQGLVRLMEEEVYVRVRTEDKEIVEGFIKDL